MYFAYFCYFGGKRVLKSIQLVLEVTARSSVTIKLVLNVGSVSTSPRTHI